MIDAETSSDDAERSKPNPDIFAVALKGLGGDVRKDRVLVVGDSPWDAIAAGRLGVRTLGVLCGGFTAADMREAGLLGLYCVCATAILPLVEHSITSV